MKRLIISCAFIMSSQFSYAGVIITGSINSNNGSVGVGIGADGTGSGNGGNGTGVVINGQEQSGSSVEQIKKDVYASICASPFMKKYASICQ
ncbi:TPA: hypothetical protein SMG11_003807 [Serratia marcescens]|uniref:hypothetical protein n=1 Tax=Serratia TaxID=613 RepID=UPI000F7E146B|nr:MULTISPECIES: hypothetical protein [Serratia]EIY8595566.1 hypothetical protein [Serratia marcescens]EIY8857402.1 hypothetical protein [Serratia marcescens]EIY8864873.1 hypothetical protein [Serratia marcescens]EIY9016891.1 hypothetical protein [Serratia marcescens]ELY3098572.1 hypothetical protein [Serratia marcescens]